MKKTLNCNANPQRNSNTQFKLLESAEPNLYREQFPYDEVPKTLFNQSCIPMNMPDDIFITDTTFRDGQQSREPYTVEQIKHIYQCLHRLGGSKGLIRQSEFFLYSQRDREAVYECLSMGYDFPEVTGWIRASKKDFELVKSIGLKETGILVSCSDYHIFLQMKMTRQQAMEHYLSIVRDCIETGIRPRCHLEDITRADFYGFVIPFVQELMKLSEESGVPIKIRACDTMGYGVTYPGAALPRSVQGLAYGLTQHGNVPSHLLEWHGHNDFYRAVSNASYAWLHGIGAVNTSLFGIGERTGNTPLEGMIFEYAQLKGTLDGMNPHVVTELAEYYEKEIGYSIPSMTPFVGKNFNVTRAGIHADGLLKNEEIYNVFDTAKILKRPWRVVISNTSGLAGIAHWLNTYFRKTGEAAFDKRHPLVVQLKEWVDEQYAGGRVTLITDDEMEKVSKSVMIGA